MQPEEAASWHSPCGRRRRRRSSASLSTRPADLGALLGEVVVELLAFGRAAVASLGTGRAIRVRAAVHRLHGSLAGAGALVADFRAILHSGHFGHVAALFGAGSALARALVARFDASLHFWGHRHRFHLRRFGAAVPPLRLFGKSRAGFAGARQRILRLSYGWPRAGSGAIRGLRALDVGSSRASPSLSP